MGIIADAGDEIAGSFSAEEFEGEFLEVGIGLISEVGGDLFADASQDVGFGPGEDPGDDGGEDETAEDPGDDGKFDGFAILVRDEDLIEKRHGQVRRDKCRSGAGKG